MRWLASLWIGLLVLALMFAVRVDARSPEIVLPKVYQSALDEARAAVLADPRLSYQKSSDLIRLAHSISDRRAREYFLATALGIQGESLLRTGDLKEARQALEASKILVLRMAPHSKLAGNILLTSGGIYAANVRVAEALNDYQTAFRIFHRAGDNRGEALSLIMIANLYSDGKDKLTVLKYLDQAAEIHSTDIMLLSSIANNKGIALQELGRNIEAAEQFRKAYTLVHGLGAPVMEAPMLRNIVRAQLAADNVDAAVRTAREAMVVATRAGGQEEPAMLGTLAELAFRRGRLAQAMSMIGRSFAGVDLEKTPMPMREAHATAYRIYRAVGDQPKALAHLEAMKRLDDQATKLATQTSTALMRARFDFANQELRIAKLKAEEFRLRVLREQEKARTERMIFLGTSVAATLLVALLGWGLFTMRRSREAIRAANDDLAVTNAALGEALAAKTEFLATTSHEIRTPLNGILGMTEVMLLDGGLSDEARERMRLVHGAGETMKALIDDILDAAKIERGGLSLESAPFDLTELLDDAARLWGDRALTKGVAFETHFDLPAAQVMGDPARLRQILFNLLSNAAKFTEAGTIRFGAAREEGRHRIWVSDTGVGIPEDKLERVFESFRQADASVTRRFGGTGLGLSISRSLARAMGGDLGVASRVGAGSVFTLMVPLADHVADPVEAATVEADTVLIVDRNPIMRAMFRNLIAPHAAHVLAFGNADEALAAITARAPRAVLIDDGVMVDEAGREIAAAARRAGAEVTLLRSPGPAEVGSYDPKDVRIVEKPVTGPALIAAVFSDRVNQDYTDPPISRAA